MFDTLFKKLGLGHVAQRVYTHLVEYGESTARHLAENLSIPRPSVYDNLNVLIENGLVTEQIKNNKKIFQADDLKNLSRLIKTKIDSLQEERGVIDELIPSLLKNLSLSEPKIKMYTGKEGVKQVLNDILWYKNIEFQSMFPMNEMVKMLGNDFFENFNRQRIRRNIYAKGLWPKEHVINAKDYPAFGSDKGFLREVRIAPNNMTWSMGYWNYADKVAIVSSKKEGFGFIISSKDFSQLLKVQFDLIWSLSKPRKLTSEFTSDFLKTV